MNLAGLFITCIESVNEEDFGGVSASKFPERVNWAGETYPECGHHHYVQGSQTVFKKKKRWQTDWAQVFKPLLPVQIWASRLKSLLPRSLLTHPLGSKQSHDPTVTRSPDPCRCEQAALSDCCHTVFSVIDWTPSKWWEKMNSSTHKFISVRYFVTKTEKQPSTKQNLLICGNSFQVLVWWFPSKTQNQNFLIKSVSIRGKGILFQYNTT